MLWREHLFCRFILSRQIDGDEPAAREARRPPAVNARPANTHHRSPRRSKIEIANGAQHTIERRRMSIDPDKELFDTAAPPPASSPPPAPGGGGGGGGIDDLSGGRWGGQDGYSSDDAREREGGIDGGGGDGGDGGDGGGGGTLVISVSWFP